MKELDAFRDVWSNPYDKALYTLLEQMVKERLGI